MAKQSKWEQFATAFNAMHGATSGLGKAIETRRIMKKEYTDDNGGVLSGGALDVARANDIADVYTKYGDVQGGLALRADALALEKARYENALNNATLGHQTYLRGEGAVAEMNAGIANTNAATSATQANTARTTALTPGEVAQQGLRNQAIQADTARTTALTPGEVTQQGLQNQAAATRNEQASADLAQNKDAVTHQRAVTALFNDALAKNPKDPAKAQEAFLTSLNAADLPMPVKTAAAQLATEYGVEAITAETVRIAQGMGKAFKDGGVIGMMKHYDAINDGFTLAHTVDPDTKKMTVVATDTAGNKRVVASGSMEEVGAQLNAVAQDPLVLMQTAAATLSAQRAADAKAQADTKTAITKGLADGSIAPEDAASVLDAAKKVNNDGVDPFVQSIVDAAGKAGGPPPKTPTDVNGAKGLSAVQYDPLNAADVKSKAQAVLGTALAPGNGLSADDRRAYIKANRGLLGDSGVDASAAVANIDAAEKAGLMIAAGRLDPATFVEQNRNSPSGIALALDTLRARLAETQKTDYRGLQDQSMRDFYIGQSRNQIKSQEAAIAVLEAALRGQ